MTNWWKLMLLPVLVSGSAILGCVDGREPTERVYLNRAVEPCVTRLMGGVDPCPSPTKAVSPSNMGTVAWDVHPLAHQNYVFHELFEATPSGIAHVVIRGIVIPQTERCAQIGVSPADFLATPSPDILQYGKDVVCFSDITVLDYVLGSGPSKLTAMTGLRGLFPGGKEFGDLVEEMKARIRSERHGREKIYALAPAYSAGKAYEAWRTVHSWPVTRNEQGVAIVTSGVLELVEASRLKRDIGTPRPDDPLLTPDERSKLEWTLEEFESRVEDAATEFEALTGGRVWDYYEQIPNQEFPSLVSDIHDLHAHFRDELKAYDVVAATPSVPPPATGEPHSYPEPPSQRPAPTYTPSPETIQ